MKDAHQVAVARRLTCAAVPVFFCLWPIPVSIPISIAPTRPVKILYMLSLIELLLKHLDFGTVLFPRLGVHTIIEEI